MDTNAPERSFSNPEVQVLILHHNHNVEIEKKRNRWREIITPSPYSHSRKQNIHGCTSLVHGWELFPRHLSLGTFSPHPEVLFKCVYGRSNSFFSERSWKERNKTGETRIDKSLMARVVVVARIADCARKSYITADSWWVDECGCRGGWIGRGREIYWNIV